MSLFGKTPFILSHYGHLGIKVRLSCRIKSNCSHVGPGPARGVTSIEGLFKRSNHVFMRVSGKTNKNHVVLYLIKRSHLTEKGAAD